MEFKTIPFTSEFDRRIFCCGKEQLDTYFRTQINQDIKKRLCVGFILLTEDEKNIKGYYTLASSSISRSIVPIEISKRFRYLDLPAALIGRLAVDINYQGQKLGELLLWTHFIEA